MAVNTIPEIDPASPLLFVINAGSGHNDPDKIRLVIEEVLGANGRAGELLFSRPNQLARVAHQAATVAIARQTAVVAVGGDGTINSVAQHAHAAGCAMGVLPQGTFNYFARTHGIPADAAEALKVVLCSLPVPVQVGLINDRVFLVNASLGLYPELLEDREAYKARFGRSRVVAICASFATLLRVHRQLRIRIEFGSKALEVTTPTRFVGNNRLQLEQVGMAGAPALDEGSIAAVMLRPVGPRAILWLVFRGAIGTLGEARTVESFNFHRMLVKTRPASSGRRLKVAFDGEVNWMPGPLEFRVSPKPLYLVKPMTQAGATGLAQSRT